MDEAAVITKRNRDGVPELYNEIPGKNVAELRVINGVIWATCTDGTRYVVPHHSEGPPVEAGPKLCKK